MGFDRDPVVRAKFRDFRAVPESIKLRSGQDLDPKQRELFERVYRRHQEMTLLENITIKFMMCLMAAAIYLAITGCCTYKGKPLSNDDAERMVRAGLDVQCP